MPVLFFWPANPVIGLLRNRQAPVGNTAHTLQVGCYAGSVTRDLSTLVSPIAQTWGRSTRSSIEPGSTTTTHRFQVVRVDV